MVENNDRDLSKVVQILSGSFRKPADRETERAIGFPISKNNILMTMSIEDKMKEESPSASQEGAPGAPSGFILKLYQMVNGAPDEVISVSWRDSCTVKSKDRWYRCESRSSKNVVFFLFSRCILVLGPSRGYGYDVVFASVSSWHIDGRCVS